MDSSLPEDLRALESMLLELTREARALGSGLGRELEQWRPAPDSWNVPECLDHLAATNRVYLDAMRPAAARAREAGKGRRGAAAPGMLGRFLVKAMEPPARRFFKAKAPATVHPSTACSMVGALEKFERSQAELCAFLYGCAGLDLRATPFPNPFVRGIRFSLATGLHLLVAHEKRHLWQGWGVRRAAEGVTPPASR